MSRSLTAAALAQATAQRAHVLHLLELKFGNGTTDTVRFTTGPHNVSWNTFTWYAAGGALSFASVAETPDPSGQRVRLTLDGVDLTAINALLAMSYVGRLGTLYRAYVSDQGDIVADPFVLFTGYMNSPWEVSEDPDGRWAKVETELVSPLAVFEQVRGIVADQNSHQYHFAGDTLFAHIASKPEGDFGWGPVTHLPRP